MSKNTLFQRKLGDDVIEVGVEKIYLCAVSENGGGGGAGAIGSATFVIIPKPGIRFEIDCPIYAGHDNVMTDDACDGTLVAWIAVDGMSVDEDQLRRARKVFSFIADSCSAPADDSELHEILERILRREPIVKRTLIAASTLARRVERRVRREAAREAKLGW